MSLLDLLLPPACASCGQAGAVLCARCVASMAAPDSGAFVVADAGVVVGSTLTLAIGAFAYEGAVRAALGRLKYGGAARVAGALATAARPAFDRLVRVTGRAAIVPVPVHPDRRRQRGYNQAELLAARLAAHAGVPLTDLLARGHATERQHRLDRAARLRNLRDAITAEPGARAPRVAVVVDDILTTSATLEACASALRGAGAIDVYGFAIAREV